MIWRFTIIQAGLETVIDEPQGWGSITKTIQRDPEMHGIVFNFSATSLLFGEDVYWDLKEEYLNNGVDGDIGIRIEWLCDDCEGYQLFYNGKFDFNSYREVCGDDCSITCGLQASEVELLIKNRMETSVDLTSNLAYDNTTILTDYPGLGKEISIPAKALLLTAHATSTPVEEDKGYEILNDADFTVFTPIFGPNQTAQGFVVNDGFILPKLNNIILTEVTDFLPQYQFDYVPDYTDSPIIDLKSVGIAAGVNQFEVSFRYKGSLYIKYWGIKSSVKIKLQMALKYGAAKTDAFPPVEVGSFVTEILDYNIHEHTINFDFSWTGTIGLATGEKIWSMMPINAVTTSINTFNPLHSLLINMDNSVSFFKAKQRSITEPTPAVTYMLHESMSRVVENITNNKYRFRSAYYGRKDSMPYSFPVNGCGGLRTLTNGLQLRRASLQDGSKPRVFLSLKDGYQSLNAIDCVGLGIEGNNVVFEPMRYFYTDEIIFVADGVNETTTTIRNDRVYNQFSFGYDKYETESTNGLDAIHTKREYRLSIKNTDQKFEKISKIIADGYATEVTRRKYGTSEDWRYDQNIFILCMNELLEVEQNNIVGAQNIFDPATVINYAISPIRNAMRWFKWLVQGIMKYGTAEVVFSSGEGNYVAKGMLTTGCIEENKVIAENETLKAALFAEASEAKPFMLPEKPSFTFPMGLNEFVFVSAKKYGKVQYRRNENDDWKYGWIDTLKFNPNDGDADFTLIPCK